jgi:hypothetical protein
LQLPRLPWGPRLRWFAAEFLVVVTGVMVALAMNAWWEGLQEKDRQRSYLAGVAAELRATETELGAEIERGQRLFEKVQQMHHAFFRASPPPMDSLLAWWELDHADPEPTIGTLHALIRTGDLRLVRDDSLRHALVWLGERTQYYDARLRKWETLIVNTFDQLAPPLFVLRTMHWDAAGRPDETERFGGFVWRESIQSLPASIEQPPFLTSIGGVLNDPDTYRAVVVYLVGTRAHRRNMQELREDVRTTLRRVESALE